MPTNQRSACSSRWVGTRVSTAHSGWTRPPTVVQPGHAGRGQSAVWALLNHQAHEDHGSRSWSDKISPLEGEQVDGAQPQHAAGQGRRHTRRERQGSRRPERRKRGHQQKITVSATAKCEVPAHGCNGVGPDRRDPPSSIQKSDAGLEPAPVALGHDWWPVFSSAGFQRHGRMAAVIGQGKKSAAPL